MQAFNSPPVKPGDVLAGKYRVERVLGAGGMGVVVAATHLELDQRVALKFLLPAALANAVAVGRFAQEARAVVRLKSEHVARVIDIGRLETGAPYIVMEHLEGADLGALLEERGPLPVAEAIDYLLQASEAVAEAHALGIIHRDLKPRNLFVTAGVDGKPLVKVLDFGISKLTSAAGSQSVEPMSLTRTNDIMGSPMYMSPEQLRSSRRVDERSDVWSLGVILYEMLTGRVPFEAESVTELCAMLLQDAHVPVGQLRPETPAGVGAAIDRCLQKHPEGRYQSVADLAAALEPFGGADARDQAGRLRSILATRARATSSGSIPVPSSRVAVTGGTSVSWGETELAPLRGRRTRVVSVLAAFVGVVGLAGLLLVWRARTAGTTQAASSPVVAAGPGTIASPRPVVPLASVRGETPPPPPSASALGVAAERPGSLPPHAAVSPQGPRTPRTPPSSVAAPPHPAPPPPPPSRPPGKPPGDLPNERE